MAMTIVESTRPVTGGVDSHRDQQVAAALDGAGALLGVGGGGRRAMASRVVPCHGRRVSGPARLAGRVR